VPLPNHPSDWLLSVTSAAPVLAIIAVLVISDLRRRPATEAR